MHRLLQINVTANWGSTGKIAEAIGLAAMKRGWESYIAYGRWSNQSQSQLIRVGNGFDKYIHFAEQRIRDNEGLCSRRATKKLIRRIEEIKPDVVQLHNIHDHYINYQILFDYLNYTGIKVVWTFHDCWAFTGHCFHFVNANCMEWKTGCLDCIGKGILPNTLLNRAKSNYDLKKQLFVGNENLTIVPCSDWMSAFVKQSFLKDKRLEVIKNGVDLNVFHPAIEKKDAESFRILAVSSVWNQEKGLDDIFKLRSLLPSDYKICLVGLSEPQLKNLPEGIEGVRRTQNVQELVRFYSNASVLVNPTYADTFPTVNLEALACGTPVVTYKTGGSPESIDENTGRVVERGDIYGLADAIRGICSCDRLQIMNDCRTRAMQEFDRDKCFEKYVELYERLIKD